MSWLRVFARGESAPPLEHLHLELRRRWPDLETSFQYDDEGWLECRLQIAAARPPTILRRYTRAADDIRGELQSWAAWIESQPPSEQRQPLMEHVMTAQQAFTLEVPGEPDESELALAVARYLARAAEGVCQVDGEGFYDAQGRLLLAEN